MLKKIGILAFWIVLWAIIALVIGQPVVLASPLDVFMQLAQSVASPSFWLAIWGTFWHIALGAVIGCIFGCVFAILSWKYPLVGEFLEPFIQFIKSAPIVCFIVLLLVWIGSTYVDLAAVALAVVPLYFFAIREGLNHRDLRLAEMLAVFGVSRTKRWEVFEWPNIRPYFTQATRNAAGMAWKSGITAELIGLTFASIGEAVYLSKLSLDTTSLLMWTIVVVILGWACEKAILKLLDVSTKYAQSRSVLGNDCAGKEPKPITDTLQGPLIELRSVCVDYHGHKVLSDLSLAIMPAHRYALTQPTGFGKTTLLHVLMGLQKPKRGSVTCHCFRSSAVFQESRLLPHLNAPQNIALTCGCSVEIARDWIALLLPEQSIDALPDEYSGGMRRCVEICRALAASSCLVIMDEPFAGLDNQTKALAIELINKHLGNRALVLATHDSCDAAALDCEPIIW